MGTFEDLGLEYSAVTSLVGLFIAAAVIVSVLWIIFFVLRAAAICDMSSAMGIKNPWYSFVPVLDGYAYGRLASRGKKSALSVIYALLQVAVTVLALWVVVAMVFGWIDLLFAADKALAAGEKIPSESFIPISKVILPLFLLGAAALARKVVDIICTCKVFAIFEPDRVIVYTVISVVLPFMLPIFLFSAKNNKPTDEKEQPDNRLSGFNFG